MKTIEFVKENCAILKTMAQYDIDPDDVKYISAVEEYDDMKLRGFKATFAAEYLSRKHGVSIANFYRALRKFNTEIVI